MIDCNKVDMDDIIKQMGYSNCIIDERKLRYGMTVYSLRKTTKTIELLVEGAMTLLQFNAKTNTVHTTSTLFGKKIPQTTKFYFTVRPKNPNPPKENTLNSCVILVSVTMDTTFVPTRTPDELFRNVLDKVMLFPTVQTKFREVSGSIHIDCPTTAELTSVYDNIFELLHVVISLNELDMNNNNSTKCTEVGNNLPIAMHVNSTTVVKCIFSRAINMEEKSIYAIVCKYCYDNCIAINDRTFLSKITHFKLDLALINAGAKSYVDKTDCS